MTMCSYIVDRKLGEGSYAQVFLLTSTSDDQKYAMKIIDSDRFCIDDQEKCLKEAELVRKLRHENIVAGFDAFKYENHIFLVTEYCSAGDMFDYLGLCRDATPQQPLPESRITDWVLQIATGLQYLHDRKILHRDLKTKNLFLTDGLTLKIGDLGIAKELDFTLDQAGSFLGTPMYMCPEFFKFQPYSYKVDIWSFGCCVIEMMTLRYAFESSSQKVMVQKILKGEYQAHQTLLIYSQRLIDLTQEMLKQNPNDRPHAAEIVQKLQRTASTCATNLPSSQDKKSSARMRRRISRDTSFGETPDLSHSLRSDRDQIVQSLMTYFQDNKASGLRNGFDIRVVSSAKHSSAESIYKRLPSQEETTLFIRGFGTGTQQEEDAVDHVGYGHNTMDTVLRSPRKKGPLKHVPIDNNLNYQFDAEDVVNCSRLNLISCKPPLNEQSIKELSNGKTQKMKKKKNFLKAVSDKQKSSSPENYPNMIRKRIGSYFSKDADRTVWFTGDEQAMTDDRSPESSSVVTLYTRSQKVVYQNKELVAGDTIAGLTTEQSDPTLQPDADRSCESALGDDMYLKACQLAAIVKDKMLLKAQLQDLLGWRNYRKYGDVIIERCRSKNRLTT